MIFIFVSLDGASQFIDQIHFSVSFCIALNYSVLLCNVNYCYALLCTVIDCCWKVGLVSYNRSGQQVFLTNVSFMFVQKLLIGKGKCQGKSTTLTCMRYCFSVKGNNFECSVDIRVDIKCHCSA
jgi:hypothetical protein